MPDISPPLPVRRPTLVVAAVLLDDPTSPTTFLAAQRARPAALDGLWEFPGGKVEDGEDPLVALHREIREELALDITIGAEVASASGAPWPLAGNRVMRVWLAWAAPGQHPRRIGTEHRELRWVSPAQAGTLPWIPADFPIVTAVVQTAWPRR